MKNVLLITIDSLSDRALKDEKYGTTAMPFFKSLIDKSIYAENYYTEGPHTEMGLQALLTGMHTLDNSSSLRRLVYADSTIYDVFRDSGYKLAYIGRTANFYPKRFYGVIEDYFTQGDSFEETVCWRLIDYLQYYKDGKMLEHDYIDLIGCFDDSFNSYLNFLNKSVHSDKNYELAKERIKKINFEERYNGVLEEYYRYCKDKRSYVEDILKNNGVFPEALLIDDNDATYEENALSNKIKPIYIKNEEFFKELKKRQLLGTFFDNRTSFLKAFSSFMDYLGKKDHEYIGQMSARAKQYNSFDIYSQKRAHIDSCSLKTKLEFLAELLEDNKDCEKPYFVYLHSLSQHDPTQWLSYDQPEEIIQKEIDEAKDLLAHTHGYKGYYAYWLGLRYVDNCLRQFFNSLNEKGLLQNTVVVVTADHGSSVCDNPIREELSFNNCHSELFHIPMLIYDDDLTPKVLSGYYTHKDLIPTLIDLCGLDVKFNGRGRSIMDSTYKPKIALSERTPSGGPILLHKPAIYTVRNDKYLIEYICGVFDSFNKGHLTHVYDLKDDPEELNNLIKTIKPSAINDLLVCAEERHKQLQDNYKSWLERDVASLE